MNTDQYWTQRYIDERTGWDIGAPSTPLKTYIDQLQDKTIRILIPGAGNAYEAEYLWKQGFRNTFVLDISEIPLNHFKERNPEFPQEQLIKADFFADLDQINLKYIPFDLILEQTFFCSFPPTDINRTNYVNQMSKLLKPSGKLVGVWFDIPLTDDFEKRPFGGDKKVYLRYLENKFETIVFEACHNSIKPRQGNELFGIFKKKEVEKKSLDLKSTSRDARI